MLIYRIAFKKFSTDLYAPGISGRWNGEGRKVIYTSESIPLAFMENMIRRKGIGFNNDFKTMIIEFPDELSISIADVNKLKRGWRSYTDYSICQSIGNEWYDECETVGLKVPSALLPGNFNYVLNSMHKDFNKIKLIKVIDLIPDERVEDILKNYSKK